VNHFIYSILFIIAVVKTPWNSKEIQLVMDRMWREIAEHNPPGKEQIEQFLCETPAKIVGPYQIKIRDRINKS
jgi:hypothetical protein